MSDLTNFLLARIADDEVGVDRRFDGIGSPSRVLAECEAKRWIVEEHRADVGADPCDAHDGATFETVDCDTLLYLAAVYADHPDYREEWKP